MVQSLWVSRSTPKGVPITSPQRILLSVGSLCALLSAASLSAPARADQSLYGESLQNGWTNYSWATVNFFALAQVLGMEAPEGFG